MKGTYLQTFDSGGGTDTLKFALSVAPPQLSWTVLSDISAIDANTNSSETWDMDAVNVAVDSNGTITVSGQDAVLTATGVVPTFRYIWLYNSSQGDKLIGYWDNGSSVDLTSGQVFTGNLDTNVLITAS
jgi:hypothetical protein